MMHDEFGTVELDGRMFGIPLSEEAKWAWPDKGEVLSPAGTPNQLYQPGCFCMGGCADLEFRGLRSSSSDGSHPS